MNRIAARRVTLFQVLLFEDIKWPDGRVHIPAGATGRAVIQWGGERWGYMVEWDSGGVAGLRAGDELKSWCRVRKHRPVMLLELGVIRLGKLGMN